MNSKRAFIVCLIVCLTLSLLGTAQAPTANIIYTEDTFQVLLSTGSSLNISYADTYVLFTADSNWNGSSSTIMVTSNYGLFQFTPENSTLMTITYAGVDTVKVNGTGIDSNTQLTYTGTTTIIWNFLYAPLLPIMFIFGMIGLVSMFFGGLNFVAEMQKKHYYKAFITSTIAIAIGIAFVLAWLWT